MVALRGGEALRAKLEEIAKKIDGKHELNVGFLENATYPDEEGTSVAQVAWWLNYGTKTAPARPYFTKMVEEKSPKWGDSLMNILVLNDYDIKDALAKMGEGISGQLRQAIVDLNAPTLSPITLMLRQMKINNPNLVVNGTVVGEAARRVKAGEDYSGASTKVGVYTGHLLNSIDYEVK